MVSVIRMIVYSMKVKCYYESLIKSYLKDTKSENIHVIIFYNDNYVMNIFKYTININVSMFLNVCNQVLV